MKKTAIALCLAAFSATVSLGVAQADPAAMQPQQQQVEITEAKLLQFTMAMDAIGEIGAKYEAQFQNAESAEQAQQIQQQAQNEMVEAVEAAGLTAAQYNAIAQQAQQDEELRDRILSMSRADS
ncbi:DUF4168 domain-containing protein [Alkalimonas delamerensis]|uniref:DUF4168 domain-containing protein n=1 Tax=Alkalimonas delamerensis TaxID=265981 RepID=A0ABT9GSR8_9GAMM|nr:DUF4168 domain-containing protein [Alkalimonas delamerensis]MDP4530012.1 DUF4168 domain-containing protein [Alkalimonas delamerensis]